MARLGRLPSRPPPLFPPQLLCNALWQITPLKVDDVTVVPLPAPKYRLPREKVLPKAKPMTKWEQYAKEKGIQKKGKRTNVVSGPLRRGHASFWFLIRFFKTFSGLGRRGERMGASIWLQKSSSRREKELDDGNQGKRRIIRHLTGVRS